MKRMTRRQACQWLAPMRSALAQIRTDQVDAIQGYAVTRLNDKDDYTRLDWCINGFLGLIDRLLPQVDTSCAKRLSNRLAAGVPLTIAEVDAACQMLRLVEDGLVGLPTAAVRDAVTAEQISIELDALGLRKAA